MDKNARINSANAVNYNELFKKELASLTELKHAPSLLLHVCCAPCLAAAIDRLAGHFDITFYYYNPNITPRSEHELRLSEVKRLAAVYGINVISEEYDFSRYKTVVGKLFGGKEHGEKCSLCCGDRIEKTAAKAKELGCEYFSTTLTSSPLKDAAFLNAKMKECAGIYGVKYLPSDFKKESGQLRSKEICEKYNIYRQHYCGCTPPANLKVALTGGIGSGKSVALKYFSECGFKVYSADKIVRDIRERQDVLSELQPLFPEAFDGDRLDRHILAGIVFNDRKKLDILERIIYARLNRELFSILSNEPGLLMIEMPLLFEKGYEKYFDVTVCVTAPVETRIERVKSRDGRSEDEIRKIIAGQSDNEKRADILLVNDGSEGSLSEKVTAIASSITKGKI